VIAFVGLRAGLQEDPEGADAEPELATP
jgi:hypothetical protein